MTKLLAFLSIVLIFFTGARPDDSFPQAQINNGIIRARFYLPDSTNGYYRGSRFDWSGVMPELEWQGHSYFGQWFEKYSPTLHDAIMGPVEDFQPAGYNEAQVGENFLKIGIGIVTKPAEPAYSIVTPYKIVNGGVWSVKKKSDKIEFEHRLNDQLYSYEYKKTVQLSKGKPEMVLLHTLKNTGSRTIETSAYDHNFFMMDKQLIGPGYVVKFPYPITGQLQEPGDLGKIENNQIVFLKNLAKNEHLYYQSIHGFSDSAKDYDIRIENHTTGAAVRITGDKPILKFLFWSAIATLCPEPYIKIKVNPGETFSWKITYQFYTCEKAIENNK